MQNTIQILGGETLLSVLANEVLQPSVSDNLARAESVRALLRFQMIDRARSHGGI